MQNHQYVSRSTAPLATKASSTKHCLDSLVKIGTPGGTLQNAWKFLEANQVVGNVKRFFSKMTGKPR